MCDQEIIENTLPEHNPADLIVVFNRLFSKTSNTRLVHGDSEPIYLPADADCDYHRVVFAHGYFASALHEIAHWCIAGERRRQWMDYGYWYAPDGRNACEQCEFEQVEVKPQALEWILSSACGKSFKVSIDNLNGVATNPIPFKQAVYRQVNHYRITGIPQRAALLHRALAEHYGRPTTLAHYAFNPEEIGLPALMESVSEC